MDLLVDEACSQKFVGESTWEMLIQKTEKLGG
jgi:hypothetical protein